jgi:hypothetical protein
MRACRLTLGAVACVWALFVLSARADTWSAAMQGEVDQEFAAPVDAGASINDGFRYVAQTYTAGVSGWLSGVSLDVTPGGTFPLRVSIHETRNGIPKPRALASSVLTTTGADFSQIIELPCHVAQLAGHGYAIVVDYPSAPLPGPSNGQGTWQGATGDLYASGSALLSNDARSWQDSGGLGLDLHFVTRVIPWRPR